MRHLRPKSARRTNQVVSPNRADAAGGREEQAGEDLAVHVHLHMPPPGPPAKGRAWAGALGPAQRCRKMLRRGKTAAVHTIHTIFRGGLAPCTLWIQGQGPHVVPLKAPGATEGTCSGLQRPGCAKPSSEGSKWMNFHHLCFKKAQNLPPPP